MAGKRRSRPESRPKDSDAIAAAERIEHEALRKLAEIGGHGAIQDQLAAMPDRPTLVDFFELRFGQVRSHCLQSAARALRNGVAEEAVFACLIHDTGMVLNRPDHGFWSEALYRPYVADKVAFALRYHQSLRFFPAPDYGYEYPEIYNRLFGENYEPDDYIQADYEYVRNHRWYDDVMQIVQNDDYSFDPDANLTIEPFIDIIGRHFLQPAEGLGHDNSATAFMWRTIANPHRPL